MSRTRKPTERAAQILLPAREAHKLLGHLARSHHFAQGLAWRLTEQNPKELAAYRAAARAAHHREGALEIDEGAPVSIADGGAYVNAWVWVSCEEVQS